MKRHNFIAVLSTAIATLALGSMVMPASASESTSQQIQELVELNPGSSYESMRNAVSQRRTGRANHFLMSLIQRSRRHVYILT